MLEVAGQKMFVIQSSLNLPCGAEKANQAIHRSTQIAFFFNWIFSLAASKLDYAKCVYSVAGSHLCRVYSFLLHFQVHGLVCFNISFTFLL